MAPGAEAPAITNIVHAARIGLIADSHCSVERPLPDAVAEAFGDVILIVHLGDGGAASGLDALEEIAPVVATRGVDDPESDPRIAPRRVVQAGGLRIGALFDLAAAGIDLDDATPAASARLAEIFAGPVDVVAFAATHQPLVAQRNRVLFVNPGSPTLPAKPGPRGLGTVAILELRGGVAAAEIVEL